MKNFILGVIFCYFLISVPKAEAGFGGDIQYITKSLTKIVSSLAHIEKLLAANTCK
jgi:hypothetical protein